MADEEQHYARPLQRALSRPVRAMSRMLNTNAPHPKSSTRPPDQSAIVDCALYIDGVRQPGERHYAEALHAARRHRGFVWIGLKEPQAAEMSAIAETFELHELAVEDAVQSRQRPKVERYGEMIFLTMRTARYVEHDELTDTSEVVETGDVLMFIGEHFIITVRHGDATRLAPVRSGLERRPEVLERGPWAVAYAVADSVVDALVEVATEIEEDIAAVEDQVFAPQRGRGGKRGADRIQRIYQLKRELMEFKRAVLPLQRPVSALVSGQLSEVPDEIRRYFRDVGDNLARAIEQVLYLDDVINSVLAARLAQTSVEQNNDMRKIAAWAAIAALVTSIAGIYGMNFDFMPETHWVFGYPGVMTLMVGGSAALFWGFRKSGWL
ncbi:magnesium and cobalt transport protein CorA [Dactylosporangium darangshiense]|uniref:Magnesium and cobalt transport protein CorA n=1 Tax=Dactylosporangium darangshiense TaxID=579108 RepID=A0ABP8CX37_9ACTN